MIPGSCEYHRPHSVAEAVATRRRSVRNDDGVETIDEEQQNQRSPAGL